MNYKQFSNERKILQRLLVSLDILRTKEVIVRINNSPDYDISQYRREEDTDYYFNNSWDFSSHAQFVVDIDFIETKLFHYDHLRAASVEFRVPFDEMNHTKFINDMYFVSKDWFYDSGFETDIDQFKLHHLRSGLIDNIKKTFSYEGSFRGNYETIDPIDWGIYSLIEITGIPDATDSFYKEIIGESYVLNRENKNKLSYFLAYSAFESFVNLELGTTNDERRLKEKVNELYKKKFANLNKHQIYCSVINMYDPFTNSRNNIAHGTNSIMVSNDELNKAFLFVLIMITSYNFNCNSFDELYKFL
jgi:hypothetical protein